MSEPVAVAGSTLAADVKDAAPRVKKAPAGADPATKATVARASKEGAVTLRKEGSPGHADGSDGGSACGDVGEGSDVNASDADADGGRGKKSAAGSGAAGGGRAVGPLRCKLPGCTSDLEVQREFNQRHRLCDDHQRALVLDMPNGPKRFCQQCNRLHPVDAFDGDKRGCRVRLERHNRRRRVRKMINKREKSQSGNTGATGTTAATGVTGTTSKSARLRTSDPDDTTRGSKRSKQGSALSSLDAVSPGAVNPSQPEDPLASLGARSFMEQMHSAWGAAQANLFGVARPRGIDPRLASLLASSAAAPPATRPYAALPAAGPEAMAHAWPGAYPPPFFNRGMGSAESTALYHELMASYQRDLASQAGYPMDRNSLQATLAVKIRDATPEALPPHLREQLLLWMRDDPESLVGYLRPGCVFLTTDFNLRKGSSVEDVAARLAMGIASAASSSDPFWSAWDMDVLLPDCTLTIRDGVVITSPREKGTAIYSVSHAATSGGQFVVSCKGWDASHSKIYARTEGRFHALSVDRVQSMEGSDVTLLSTRMPSCMELGVAWLEVVTEKAGEIVKVSKATPVLLTANPGIAEEICSIVRAVRPAAGSLLSLLEDVSALLHRPEDCALATCAGLARLAAAFGCVRLRKEAAGVQMGRISMAEIVRFSKTIGSDVASYFSWPNAQTFASVQPCRSGALGRRVGAMPIWTCV